MTKPQFAQIHGGLLARKGAARPAAAHPLADVSYNDASSFWGAVIEQSRAVDFPPSPDRPPAPAPGAAARPAGDRKPAPARSAPHRSIPSRPAADRPPACGASVCAEPSGAPAGTATAGEAYKVALRLDTKERQLLRIAAAVLDRPQQAILQEALRRHLKALASEDLKPCGCFARRVEALGAVEARGQAAL